MSTAGAIQRTLIWQGRTIRLSYVSLYCGVIDHLEITVEGRQPIPITETGYKSHFFGPMDPPLTEEGVLQFSRDWIEQEARSSAWREAEASRRQHSLF